MPLQSPEPSKRVVVFIDGMNVLNDARRAFGSSAESTTFGQINPMRYGHLLASRKPHGQSGRRVLKEVRIYRGRPHPRKQARTHAAHMRQTAAWESRGARVITRNLRYPENWPKERAEEKGIDVEIAIDMVTMAINRDLDVAILASTDTDLRPALEAFFKLPGPDVPIPEVATWRAPHGTKQLRVDGHHLWCHFLEEADYRDVQDRRDYNIGQK